MENLDFFFPDISTQGSRNVLLADPKPFSFLVRKVNKEYVVSFVDPHLNVHDVLLPQPRRDCPLLVSNPHLTGSLEIFEYVRNISRDWLHPVTRGQHDVTGDKNIHLSQNCCQICGITDPSKSHRDKHRLWYCATCDTCLPRNSRNHHKCGDKTLFKCDFCDYYASSDKVRADHIKAVHMKSFKCSKCTASFATNQQLRDHQGRDHGGGFSCPFCGKLYETVSGRNKHRIKCKSRPDLVNNSASDTNNNPNMAIGGHEASVSKPGPGSGPASSRGTAVSDTTSTLKPDHPPKVRPPAPGKTAAFGRGNISASGIGSLTASTPGRPHSARGGITASTTGSMAASIAGSMATPGNLTASTSGIMTASTPGSMASSSTGNMAASTHGQGYDPEAGSGLHDHDRGFINIQLELPEDSQRPEAEEAGPGGHERQDSVLSASISGHQSHSLSDMAETEDLAKTDQRHEVRGHMYASGGQEPWAREIGDTRDLGLEDRDQLMSPTQNPNRESSYLGKGHDLEGGSGIHGQDQGFINIQLEFPEDSQRPEAAEVSDSTMGWHGRETEDITKNGQERVASNPSNLQSSPPPASDSQPSPPDQPPKGSPSLELWLKMQQMKMRGKSFCFSLPRGLIISLLFMLNIVSTYLKKMLTPCDHPLPLDDGDWARRGRPRKQDMHDCEECGKGYVRRKALQHQKSCKHTKIKAKMKAKCKWCSYSSSLKTNVSRHEKTCRGRPQIVKTLSPDAIWRIGK